MSDTRTLSLKEWWDQVDQMVDKVQALETLDEKSLTEAKLHYNELTDVKPISKKEIDAEKANPEYRKIKGIYKELAKVGVTLEDFSPLHFASAMSAKQNLLSIGKKFDIAATPPIQKIIGPLSLELAYQYLMLQEKFIRKEISPQSKLTKAGLGEAATLAEQRAEALKKAIQAYHAQQKEKKLAEERILEQKHETPPSEQKSSRPSELISIPSYESIEEKKESAPRIDFEQELREINEDPFNYFEQKKETGIINQDQKEQLELLSQLKKHLEIREAVKKLSFPPDQYSDIERYLNDKNNNPWQTWNKNAVEKKSAETMANKLWYTFMGERNNEEETNVLNQIRTNLIRTHYNEMERLSSALKTKGIVLTDDLTSLNLKKIKELAVGILKPIVQANKAEEDQRIALEVQEKKRQEAERKAAATAAKLKDDAKYSEIKLDRFYGYIAQLLDKNHIKHDMKISSHDNKITDYGTLDHKRIENYMDLYQKSKNMTQEQLDFLIILEAKKCYQKMSQEENRKIDNCIDYIKNIKNNSPKALSTLGMDLSDMQQTLKQQLEAQEWFSFFSRSPLKDLIPILDSLVKSEKLNQTKLRSEKGLSRK